MPNPQNIQPHQFKPGPEINDTLMVLLSMDLEELKAVFDNPKSTVLEKAVASAIRKSIEKGSLYNIVTIITRLMEIQIALNKICSRAAKIKHGKARGQCSLYLQHVIPLYLLS
jgi:hypothetical protein